MVKANELRIGNLIEKENIVFDYVGGCKNIPIKIEVTLSNILEISNSNMFTPITLTPEILEKNCGFHKVGWYWVREGFDLEVVQNNNGFNLSINGNEYDLSTIFYYVHQLQNIYFALTGKELPIQL
jgi:hypothetical protein